MIVRGGIELYLAPRILPGVRVGMIDQLAGIAVVVVFRYHFQNLGAPETGGKARPQFPGKAAGGEANHVPALDTECADNRGDNAINDGGVDCDIEADDAENGRQEC